MHGIPEGGYIIGILANFFRNFRVKIPGKDFALNGIQPGLIIPEDALGGSMGQSAFFGIDGSLAIRKLQAEGDGSGALQPPVSGGRGQKSVS